MLADRVRLVTVLVGGLLLGAVLAFVIDLADAPTRPADAVDLLTGAGMALGIVAALFARTRETGAAA
jgi:hypothetical protein